MSDTVCAVIVTHNRLPLLRECLAAIRDQSRPVDAVLVVDNASTDDTAAAVAGDHPEADLLRLEVNGGGAGGFHAGMDAAHQRGFDWTWVMDDDTVPTRTALECLLAGAEAAGGQDPPALLASKVVWTDDTLHPKNIPFPRTDLGSREDLVDGAARGLLLIRAATFVSVLVNRRAVEAHGLPHAHYFIWGDDGEFTARVLRSDRGYLVPASVVHHKTPAKQSVFQSGPQYYYELRNKVFMLRGASWTGREKLSLAAGTAAGLTEYLRRNRLSGSAVKTVATALRDGVRQDPERAS